MIGIEQTVTKNFAAIMQRKAEEYNFRVETFPLNGQDRDAAGDAICSNGVKLNIVEFKSREKDLPSEKGKPRRKTLCELLQKNLEMQRAHDKCHFAAWMNKEGLIEINIYRMEICNQRIFPNSDLIREPEQSSRQFLQNFAEKYFYGEGVGLELDEFEKYLEWVLTGTSGSEKSTVEVQALDVVEKSYKTIEFSSIREAHIWISKLPKPGRKSGGSMF